MAKFYPSMFYKAQKTGWLCKRGGDNVLQAWLHSCSESQPFERMMMRQVRKVTDTGRIVALCMG